MLDFPDTPYPGQRFREWKWDGEKWVMISTTGWAPLDSPDFVGMPTAPTPPPGSNDAKIATTAFVMQAIEHHTAGVASFNGRTGHVWLTLQDVFEAGGAPLHAPHFTGAPEADTPPEGDDSRRLATTEFVQRAVAALADNVVLSWNGRIGEVVLTWADVSAVGAAPITSPQFLGSPRAPTPPPQDRSTKLATTEFVARAVDQLGDEIDHELEHTVRSWNQRTGNVEFRPSDLSAVGGAFLNSPHFTGVPTAPTAPPHTDNAQLATTRYVDDAIASNPGPPGPPGHPGPQGIPGQGYRLKGSVRDKYDLPTSGNAVGDTWIVDDTGEGWTWTGAVWAPVGPLRGPPGPPEAPRYHFAGANSYTATLDIDVVMFYGEQGMADLEFRLPQLQDVPEGKTIQVNAVRIYSRFTIASGCSIDTGSGYVSASQGWRIEPPGAPYSNDFVLTFIKLNNWWWVINEGSSFTAYGVASGNPFTAIGKTPSPRGQSALANTPNPLNVDPGTDFVYVATVDGNVGPRTIQLPPTVLCRGHTVRIVAASIINDGQLTITAAAGEFLLLPGAGFWGFGSPSFTFDTIANGGPGTVDVVLTAHPGTGGSWTLGNFNIPFKGTAPGGRRFVNGTVPMPPDGTPSTYVLHADMTWGPS